MSMTRRMKGNVDIQRLPMDSEEHQFTDWTIKYKQSHILHSQCLSAEKCSTEVDNKCLFCVYTNTLELPHLPEMVFAKNILNLMHSSGAQIEFNALDALKTVRSGPLPVKVACSDAWRESRLPSYMEEKIKFDWTFTSDYRGTISGPFNIISTDERINMEKLKEREKILFYHELMLYEDELHDNGIASCTVKIRVMPSSYFILLRYFLRVDNVLVRLNDTRLFHEFGTNYVLREYTHRESGCRELGLPLPLYGDPNMISPHLPLRNSIYEKLILPGTSDSGSTMSSEPNSSTEPSASSA